MQQQFTVRIATIQDISFSAFIVKEMEVSAKARGTGIAQRSTTYIEEKIKEGKAIIAFNQEGIWAGFCYIETWSDSNYVANSGLIVAFSFRNCGLAKLIKKKIFELSRKKYPDAKIFGLTTGLAVMKINSELAYEPVTYSELTQDDNFWASCKSCVNYDILTLKERKNCLCTAMLYDPKDHYQPEETKEYFTKNKNLYERFLRSKQSNFIKRVVKKD